MLFIYDEKSSKTLNLVEIINYLKIVLGVSKVELRGDFLPFWLNSKSEQSIEEVSNRIAATKIRDIKNRLVSFKTMPGEISYEKNRILSKEKKSFGLLYDGFKLGKIFSDLIDKNETSISDIHIIFTNRLVGSWDDGDKKFHARAVICGNPSIISTSGIIEAPAKPREFYLNKAFSSYAGVNSLEYEKLKQEYKGRFIDYDDERLKEVVKGYVMQALFFVVEMECFCDDKGCRLYNAHWQEDLIHAQIGSNYEFCKKHEKMLRNLKKKLR